MSGLPSLTIISDKQKFNGDNLLQWKTNITQLLGAKGLLGYTDEKILKPAASSSSDDTKQTPVYSTTPTIDESNFRDQLARGRITLQVNCTDVASQGVVTAKEAYDSILNEWGKSTDMRRSHADKALSRTTFSEGSDIQDHIKLLQTQRVAVDNLQVPPQWMMKHGEEPSFDLYHLLTSHLPTSGSPSLYALTSSSDILSTLLLAHGMVLGRDTKTTSNSSTTALAAGTRTEGCTNPNCKAKKCTTLTTANCYWPGGGKEGQFPSNFGQRSKVNTATTTPDQTTHLSYLTAGRSGVLIEEIPDYHRTTLISNAFQKYHLKMGKHTALS
jgi:hypothetical protein